MIPVSYSVLLPVYERDHPEWFRLAIDSLLNQTNVSDDIVIVVDGPVGDSLEGVLNAYDKLSSINIVRIEKNQGLGNALNVGIESAKHDLIGRMDADDISVPNRFELQLAEFSKDPGLEILGGQIAEFINSPNDVLAYRNVPIFYDEIKSFARRRSPFNHPTVMYRKSTIQRLGGYDVSAIRIEDYDLWLRALSVNVRCSNIDSVLLWYRSTKDAMKRRKTLHSLKSHLKAKMKFYNRGYISFTDFLFGAFTQALLFAIPTKLASVLFNVAVRSKNVKA